MSILQCYRQVARLPGMGCLWYRPKDCCAPTQSCVRLQIRVRTLRHVLLESKDRHGLRLVQVRRTKVHQGRLVDLKRVHRLGYRSSCVPFECVRFPLSSLQQRVDHGIVIVHTTRFPILQDNRRFVRIRLHRWHQHVHQFECPPAEARRLQQQQQVLQSIEQMRSPLLSSLQNHQFADASKDLDDRVVDGLG